jgi:hypothetical protein
LSPAAAIEPRSAAGKADPARELRRRVFEDVFERLAAGFVEGRRRRGLPPETDETLAQVFAATLRLLSRVLFVAVSEARGLLPADGAPAYALYGLSRIRRAVAERIDSGEPLGDAAAETWDDLLSLLDLVDHGDPALGIPGPGGGLLPPADPREAFLRENPVPGVILARALDHLSRVDGELVDFAALGADGVLAVLDGLPAMRLAADERGRPRLMGERGERKIPAPTALPRWLAEYLLAETVGPAVDERIAAFRRTLGEVAERRRRVAAEAPDAARLTREADAMETRAVDALLDLRVLDPAMGCGRFLLAAAEWIAARYLPLLEETEDGPLHDVLAELRADVLADARAQGIAIDPARLPDAALLERIVARRCLFGVDPSPEAVELARAALALEAAVPGAPPLFLAHHLRRGHPLAGARVAEVRRALEESPEGQFEAFGGPFDGLLAAARPLRETEDGGDATWAAAAESAVRDGEARAALAPYRRMLDLWVSRAFGNRRAEEVATLHPREILSPGRAGDATLGAPQREALDRAEELAREHGFFHWDLEMPAVFADLGRGAWSGDPGFDAVAGRAPERDERLAALRPHLAAACADVHESAAEPHAYLYLQALGLLRRGGRAGFAGPGRWVRGGAGESLRRLLSERAALQSVVDFPADGGAASCVAVVRRAEDGKGGEARVAVVPREAHGAGAHAWVARHAHPVPASRFGAGPWSLEPQVIEALLRRVRDAGVLLRDFAGASPRAGVRTGLNDAYVVDGAVRERIVSEHPAADALIRPYLRGQDVERWSPGWAGLWVILIGSGEGERWPWTGLADPEAERAFRGAYPSLYAHLKPWEDRLRLRQDQGGYWWEMRGGAHPADFDAPKVVYPDVAWAPAFALDAGGHVPAGGAGVLPGSPWLAAMLNSPVLWAWLWRTAGHGRDEALRLTPQIVETLPIPRPTAEWEADAAVSVARLGELAHERRAVTAELFRWLRSEYGVAQPGPRLEAFADLNATDFVEEVRRRRPKKADALAPREVGMLRNAHAELAPRLTAVQAKIAGLERRMGQMAARAYGLSPDEVELLCAGLPAAR